MDLTVARCFVQVHDPALALTFYRDALGLELRNDVAREDFRWITVGAADQPGVEIVLTNYVHGSSADGDAVAALLAKGAHLQGGARLGRRDRAGADRPAVGNAGLCGA
jgi:catechol 2,3-dioxygenase-like lactoylglutathione lyase family enzyme